MNKYTIYTDGACSGNPGPGGWGAVILSNDDVVAKLSGSAEHTTNNQMELTGAIESIKWIYKKEDLNIDTGYTLELFASPDRDKNNQIRLDIYTDSVYVQKGITEYIKKWRINGWRTANKKPIANIDLWINLDKLDSGLDIVRHWIKGHDGNHYNELADELATKNLY